MPGSAIAKQIYRGPTRAATSHAARPQVDLLSCRKNLARSIAIEADLVKSFLSSWDSDPVLTPNLVCIIHDVRIHPAYGHLRERRYALRAGRARSPQCGNG
jgi:hypothetical protein